jgi:hypothetical protein
MSDWAVWPPLPYHDPVTKKVLSDSAAYLESWRAGDWNYPFILACLRPTGYRLR